MFDRAKPAKMKKIGKAISITKVLTSLIYSKNFFLVRALKLVMKQFKKPVSCYSAIE